MTDTLTAAYLALANMQNIDDVQDYALAWRELADIATHEGRPALAGMCASRAEFYGAEKNGEYIRLIDGSFSELVPVDFAEPLSAVIETGEMEWLT